MSIICVLQTINCTFCWHSNLKMKNNWKFDQKYSRTIGRRKTYILPTQYLVRYKTKKWHNVSLKMSIILIIHAFFIEDHINNKNIVVIGIVDVIFSLLITLKVSFIFKFTNFPKSFFTLEVYNFSKGNSHGRMDP